MVSNSNNNIILVLLVIFIVLFICITYYNRNKNNNNDNRPCSICNENFTTTKKKVKFERKDNVKYFNNKESPSDISNIETEKEYNNYNNNNIEEFDYGDSIDITKDYKDIDINKDSNKLTNFEKVNPDDTISQKFNKLLGNIENDISDKNLNLIQGVGTKSEPLKYKTEFIYNNTLESNTPPVNYKYQPFNGNSYRSI